MQSVDKKPEVILSSGEETSGTVTMVGSSSPSTDSTDGWVHVAMPTDTPEAGRFVALLL